MTDILFCGNDKVFDGVLTASLSIVRRLEKPRPITIHIFTMELTRVKPDYLPLTQAHAGIIREALRKHNPETEVKLYDVTKLYEQHLKENANEGCYCSPYTLLRLLGAVTFRVAQDQDYLNVICRNRVLHLDGAWNTMPCGIPVEQPKLIHYNLDSKPWQRDDVAYGELFWDYADRSGFLPQILAIRAGFTQDRIERSAQETLHLIDMGQRQARQRTRNLWINWKNNRVVNL